MGPPDRVACLETISFSDKEKHANMEDHNRPNFILGIFRNKAITQKMNDNGSAVNITPL